MEDADVSRQIQQMVSFIHQEAEEKANEISVSAEEVSSSFQLIDAQQLLMPPSASLSFLQTNARTLTTICFLFPTFLF